MGTEFFELRKPWSSVQRIAAGQHVRLAYFVDGKLSGELVFDAAQHEEIAEAMLQIRGRRVAKRSATADGPRIRQFVKPLPKLLISEFGDLLRADQMETYRPTDSWWARHANAHVD